MEELYPLSKKEFETLYDKAWENGWVYGRFFQELYDEYLVNWVYFVDYLDVLKGASKKSRMYARVHDKFVIVIAKNQQPILIEAVDYYGKYIIGPKTNKGIEILIGEAPPYWKGNAKNKDKSYFYNPSQTNSSPWLNAPADWKSSSGKFKAKAKDLKDIKIEKLKLLAEHKVVLIDVFPFPIIQDTKIRQAISGKFPEHIEEYFIPKLESIIEYIDVKKENIRYGFVATTYGSLHLLFGDKTRDLFIEFDDKFYTRGIVLKALVTATKFVYDATTKATTNCIVGYLLKTKNKKLVPEPTVLFKTIYKLVCPEAKFKNNFNKIKDATSFDKDSYVGEINRILQENLIPILMDGSGYVNFSIFFNSPIPSIEKFETEEKKQIT